MFWPCVGVDWRSAVPIVSVWPSVYVTDWMTNCIINWLIELTDRLTNLLIPLNSIILERLIAPKLVKNSAHSNQAVCEMSRHLSLFWMQALIQFLYSIFNIILPSTRKSFKWSFPLSFPQQNPESTSTVPLLATCSDNLILVYFITRIIFGEYNSWSSSLCSLLKFPAILSLWAKNIFLGAIFPNTASVIIHNVMNT